MPVIVDGTAGITFPQGATQIVGAGPAFGAYRSGTNQSVSLATWTKVQLNGEVFDTNNNFDSTTNYRFTPTIAGYYQLNAGLYSAGTSTYVAIYYNGARTFLAGTSLDAIGISQLSYFNGTTDYAELYGYVGVGTAQFQSSSGTFLSGSLVRGV